MNLETGQIKVPKLKHKVGGETLKKKTWISKTKCLLGLSGVKLESQKEKKEKPGQKKIHEEILAKNLSEMMTENNPQIQRKHSHINGLKVEDRSEDNGWVSARMTVKNLWKTQTEEICTHSQALLQGLQLRSLERLAWSKSWETALPP